MHGIASMVLWQTIIVLLLLFVVICTAENVEHDFKHLKTIFLFAQIFVYVARFTFA